jgi:tetratricopeptide (TPR) repeat protein
MRIVRTFTFFAVVLALAGAASGQTIRSVEITTVPAATIWINGIRYGTTGEDGKLAVRLEGATRASVRVRAYGFKEAIEPILPAAKELTVTLTKTTDEAELAFQDAERMTAIDRPKAAEGYRKALKLRPNYPEANVGLARTMAEQGGIEEAFRAINAALRQRPAHAEAAAVKGRLLKDTGEEERAIAEFKRAITLGKGVQAEANTGLGMLYQERADEALAGGEVLAAEQHYAEAAKYFSAAIKQLGISPDASVVYQLQGRILEQQRKYKDAISLYQQFLKIFPDSIDATAVQSFITQLQKQLADQ